MHLGWLLRLKIDDSVEIANVFAKVIEAEREGKDIAVIRHELEAQYGLNNEVQWVE